MDILKDRFPNIPDRIAGLGELAYNLWWNWHPEARMLFKMLDRQLWKESLHNPVKMLKELPPEVLESTANHRENLRHYDAVLARFRHYVGTRGGWFRENLADSGSLTIAYFSAEYGLHHSLPFYAGAMDNPDGQGRVTGFCGDTIKIVFKFEDNKVKEVGMERSNPKRLRALEKEVIFMQLVPFKPLSRETGTFEKEMENLWKRFFGERPFTPVRGMYYWILRLPKK